MTDVHEVAPDVDSASLLAGAQFIDAFSIELAGKALDARHAAERMLDSSPLWIEALTRLRNLLVAPFGLKTSGKNEMPPARNSRPVSDPDPDAGPPGRGF